GLAMFVALDRLVPLVSVRQSHEQPHAALPAGLLYSCLSGQAGLQVNDLVNITTSRESEVYAFDMEHGSDEDRRREALVLHFHVGDHAHAKSAHVFQSIRRLHQAGYPVPSVYLLEPASSSLGKPCITMERIAGQVMRLLFFRAHGRNLGSYRHSAAPCACSCIGWTGDSLLTTVARYATRELYVFVDRSRRREHNGLTQFSLLGFLPLSYGVVRHRGRWRIPTRPGKSPMTAVRLRVERSKSLAGGGKTLFMRLLPHRPYVEGNWSSVDSVSYDAHERL